MKDCTSAANGGIGARVVKIANACAKPESATLTLMGL
jgi:hypothetical protein